MREEQIQISNIDKSENKVKIGNKDRIITLQLEAAETGFKVEDRQGNEVVSTFPGNNFSYKNDKNWFQLEKLLSWSVDNNQVYATYSSKNGQKVEMLVEIEAEGIISFNYEVEDKDDISWLGFSLTSVKDEHYYGFGEKFNQLDQKGETVDLWVRNGASGDETYKPVPFYFSTSNYGLYLDTTCKAICQMGVPGREEQVEIKVNDRKLKYYLFLGEDPKDIIKKYTSITGRAAMPPAWSFGPWKSRFAGDQCRHVIYEDADKHRQLDIPCSVIVLDGWWDQDMFNPEFNEDYYPAGEEMVKELHKQGYRVIGWVAPWVVRRGRSQADWEKCDQKGYFIKDKKGDSYVCRLANSPHSYGSILDFTNPEVVEMWQNRIKGFIELGIDGIKTDFGEQVPADAVFYNGKTGREMHNVYPRLYNKLTWEVMGAHDGVLFGRSAWAGSQQYPGIWAGDQTADFCPWTGLGSVVVAGQAAALSGFPFWASDVGGYFSSPTAECFIRWAQYSAFCPWMQIHGNGRHEPWSFDRETEDIYRKYADVHTRLFPYLYSYARKATENGLPIIRPLVLNYSNDENIYRHDFASYQYQLGEELLVAPVYWDNMTSRLVYLPQGRWVDFWSEKEYRGGQIVECSAPLDKIPVFIKEGSIIPLLGKNVETLVDYEVDYLELLIYCGDENSGNFKLDDGTDIGYRKDERILALEIDSTVERDVKAVFKNLTEDKVLIKEFKTGTGLTKIEISL